MVGDVIGINAIKRMKQAVNQKVNIEKQKYMGSGGSQPPVVSSQFVLKALYANEDGDACLLKLLFKDRICFDHSEGQWFRFNGSYWEKDIVKESLNALAPVVEIYNQEVPRQAQIRTQAAAQGNTTEEERVKKLEENLLKRIRSLQTLQRKKHILELASAGINSLGISGNEWDSDPWLLGCANGVVDLKSGHFREGRATDYIRKAVPTEWQGFDAPAARWEQFILEIFDNDQDLANFIQRLLGYAITGDVAEHIFPILWGRGRNGKGTMLEILKFIMGDLAEPLQTESLMEQRFTKPGSAPSPDIMALRGRRITWASESEKKHALNLGKVKWLVGGDSIKGRDLYAKDETTFEQTYTLFLLTNYKPKIIAEDYAAWDRIYLIPFNLSFVSNPKESYERQKDQSLNEKLRQEAPGILAWLVTGCLKYHEIGLDPPDIVLKATQEYREEEDDYKDFLDNCCVIYPHAKIKASDFYQAYKTWSEENLITPESSKSFYSSMAQRFNKSHTNRGNYYSGVELIKLDINKEDINKLNEDILL